MSESNCKSCIMTGSVAWLFALCILTHTPVGIQITMVIPANRINIEGIDHENSIGDLAQSIGFTYISLSNDVMPMVKIVPRGTSAVADAYLTPCIQKYIQGFVSGFDDGFEAGRTKLQFMQSDGGLVPVNNFSGFKAILSGPAGGVVGYSATSYEDGQDPVIGFDMGGTSTGGLPSNHNDHIKMFLLLCRARCVSVWRHV